MIRMKIVGEAEMAKRLAALGASAGAPLDAAVRAGALIVQNAAKQRVPKRTRTLSRSIMTEVERQGDEVVAHIGPTVEYGRYVELGTGKYAVGGNGRQTPWVYRGPGGKFFTTSGQRPQPYMRPALDENRARAVKEIARVFGSLIARAAT